MTHLRTIVLLFAVSGNAGTLSAQAVWERIPLFPTASGAVVGSHRMVWDPTRQRVVLVNGFADVWEWNGSWANVHSAALPPSLISIAYDLSRQRTVLYSEGLTSEWDGTRWTQRFPQTSPPFRTGERMVYDAARNRVVLFGGRDAQGTPLGDTWQWDGVNWVQRLPATAPPARFDHAMTYDTARARVVLFGGTRPLGTRSDTWEWDGSAWVQLFPASTPPPRSRHDLAYDAARQRVVLFGPFPRDTWEWDGSAWTRHVPATAPPGFAAPALAYHHARQRIVLWGGGQQTWEWDGNDWTVTTAAPTLALTSPVGHAFVYDARSERSLLLAEKQHWEWDGTRWTRRGSLPQQTRYGHAAAYDAAREKVVLYGGFGPNETWEWDGTTWVRQPGTSPPAARYDHAMTYDASRRRVVMFGGFVLQHTGRPGWLEDTWEWDGTRWQQRTPATAPSRRGQTAMAYDAARQRAVLFGGSATSAASGAGLADTWEWDGTTWTRRTPANAPPPRLGHTMTYDSGRGRVVLFGGKHFGIPHADTWEWDGVDWVRSATITSSWFTGLPCTLAGGWVPNPGCARSVATYDAARQRVVMFDGKSTWEYDPHPSAAYTPFGSGCAGPAGVPQLAAAPGSLPWAEGSFTARLAPIAPGQPAVLFFGVSRTSWSGFPLPLSLAALGRPDCQVLVSLDFAVPLATAGSAATLTIPRLAPSLAGGVFYNQGASLDLTTGIAGLAFSNGARAEVGAR